MADMHAQRDRKVIIMMMIVSVAVCGCRQAVKDLRVVDVGLSCHDTTAARVRSCCCFCMWQDVRHCWENQNRT